MSVVNVKYKYIQCTQSLLNAIHVVFFRFFVAPLAAHLASISLSCVLITFNSLASRDRSDVNTITITIITLIIRIYQSTNHHHLLPSTTISITTSAS